MTAFRIAAPALFCLVAACEFSADQSRANEAASSSGNQVMLAPPAPLSPPAAPTAVALDLSFEANGLRVLNGKDAVKALRFGMATGELLAALEAFRGPADRGTNGECGAGPLDYAAWADGLTLHFQDGRFAGWALDPRAEGAHATTSGIGPGSTRRAIEAAHQATVEQTTLGSEFEAEGISGVLDGLGPEARIGNMWAGVSCVFR